MGRMKPEYIDFIKTNYQFPSNTIVGNLVEHIEAIELELKISKEDEQEAVRKYGEAVQDFERLADSFTANQEVVIKRLMENVAQLQRELTDARESKKIALPQKVVDAIRCGLGFGWNEGNVLVRSIRRDWESDYMEPLNIYASLDAQALKLASALLHGYIIEEPPSTEDRIEAKLEGLLKENNVDSVVPVRELVVLLTIGIREVLADDRQKETT